MGEIVWRRRCVCGEEFETRGGSPTWIERQLEHHRAGSCSGVAPTSIVAGVPDGSLTRRLEEVEEELVELGRRARRLEEIAGTTAGGMGCDEPGPGPGFGGRSLDIDATPKTGSGLEAGQVLSNRDLNDLVERARAGAAGGNVAVTGPAVEEEQRGTVMAAMRFDGPETPAEWAAYRLGEEAAREELVGRLQEPGSVVRDLVERLLSVTG